MDKLREISLRRKRAHSRLLELDSGVYSAFLTLEKAAYREGALTKKTKELVAIGIAVVKDCESCMQWHIEQAARAGASSREVLDVLMKATDENRVSSSASNILRKLRENIAAEQARSCAP